jgi:hemoglobin
LRQNPYSFASAIRVVERIILSELRIPTLFEWAGGMPALDRLTTRFYERVRSDELLREIFAHMDAHHPHFVAQFLAEVLGGPADYSRERGGHPHMIRQHLARHLTDVQRKAWMQLLLDTADEVGVPADPEFRSALVGYLEWGSRLAVINSQPAAAAEENLPMPLWGWGVPGGPYQG